jgi:hypothetical protein
MERWGGLGFSPYHPIAATVATGRIILPPIRFVCDPDRTAFAGTRTVMEAESSSGEV